MTDRIEELKALCEGATRGPWLPRHNLENGTMHSWDVMQHDFAPRDKYNYPARICESVRGTRFAKKSIDCELIAASRTALPALLALVEQLEGALEDARDDLARYNETKFDCENAINKALAAVREFREGK